MTARQRSLARAALDALALALASKGYRWPRDVRRLYERAIRALS